MDTGAVRAQTVLITGAGSGIGLEFAKEYAARGWTVVATYHREKIPETLAALSTQFPALLTTERMDVTDLAMIDAVARRYRGKPIDVLINNAGVVGDLQRPSEQEFGHLRHDLFDLFMRTNVQAPLKVSEAFLDNVKLSRCKVIVTISSAAGSFTSSATNRPGRVYYKVSKAAANMAMQSVATATQADGITVVAIHPGGVRSFMYEPNSEEDLDHESRLKIWGVCFSNRVRTCFGRSSREPSFAPRPLP